MPVHRRKASNTCAEPSPLTVRKPRKPRGKLTEEEKLEAEVKRIAEEERREAMKEWESELIPWVPRGGFSWPEETVVRALLMRS